MRRYNNVLRLLSSMEMSEDGVRQFLPDRSESGAIWEMGEDGLVTDRRGAGITLQTLGIVKAVAVVAGFAEQSRRKFFIQSGQ